MELGKKIGFRLILIACLLVIFNFIYKKYFYENDLQKYSDIINLVKEVPDSTDILYIGESSNTNYNDNDLDKRPISEFISDYYPTLNVNDITKPASHSGIYKVLLENLPQTNQTKTIVVTLNLRSFNAQWIYSDLETPLQKSIVLLKDYPPLVNRFLLSFKGYDIKSDKEREQQVFDKWYKDRLEVPNNFQFENVKEWDNWMANKGILDENGNWDQPQTELACHYIKAYGFQIDTNSNPRIKDFNDIVNLAKERGWNIVFNLLAENTQKAKELVGNDLIYFINENVKLLQNYYERKGVIVVNNINLVDDEQFNDQNWTTEHYAEKGRKIIANSVALSLKKWYSKAYKVPNYISNVKTNFFNNFDEELIWSQMQTLTKEQAFSGVNSSKTGKGNDFSVTFAYPLHSLPDSVRNNVYFKCKVYQTTLNENIKLNFEFNGDSIINQVKSFTIKDSINFTNQWSDLKVNISFDNEIKKADLIKIYIYNPTNDVVYIDDMSIKFD